MAHHNNTPQSVLDAPSVTVRWVAKHTGLTRVQRRQRFLIGNRRLWGALAATNVPYVKPKGQTQPQIHTLDEALSETV